MITVQGMLTVREINGKYGLFKTGRLVSEIGEFAIKSTLIEQYEPGNYEGRFFIKKVFAGSYNVGNRFTVEVRADLDRILLDSFDDELPPPEFAEPDPLEEERHEKPAAALEAVFKEELRAVSQPSPTAEPSATPDLQRIFGSLWPLGDRVKLDPTIDRALFREQVAAIGKNGLGYTFEKMGQVWIKP